MKKDYATVIASGLAESTSFSNPTGALWTIGSSLETDVFPDPIAHWLASGEAIAYWVASEGGLFVGLTRALADGGCEVKVMAHHLDVANWSIELTCENSMLGAPLAHPGLKTKWTFRSTDDFNLEVPGEVVFRGNEPGEPDDAERFARALAQRLDWPRQQK